jgi:hypothetical protein
MNNQWRALMASKYFLQLMDVKALESRLNAIKVNSVELPELYNQRVVFDESKMRIQYSIDGDNPSSSLDFELSSIDVIFLRTSVVVA